MLCSNCLHNDTKQIKTRCSPTYLHSPIFQPQQIEQKYYKCSATYHSNIFQNCNKKQTYQHEKSYQNNQKLVVKPLQTCQIHNHNHNHNYHSNNKSNKNIIQNKQNNIYYNNKNNNMEWIDYNYNIDLMDRWKQNKWKQTQQNCNSYFNTNISKNRKIVQLSSNLTQYPSSYQIQTKNNNLCKCKCPKYNQNNQKPYKQRNKAQSNQINKQQQQYLTKILTNKQIQTQDNNNNNNNINLPNNNNSQIIQTNQYDKQTNKTKQFEYKNNNKIKIQKQTLNKEKQRQKQKEIKKQIQRYTKINVGKQKTYIFTNNYVSNCQNNSMSYVQNKKDYNKKQRNLNKSVFQCLKPNIK